MNLCWLHKLQQPVAIGSWHHCGQDSLVSKMDISFCSFGSHDMYPSERYIDQGSHDQLQHVGLCSVYAVALRHVMPTGTEVLQGSADVH